MKKDIKNIEDVKLLVNTFYNKVQQDDLIGPIFNEKLDGKWEIHLQKMYQFWETILLEEHSYSGRPFPPHAHLPVSEPHFLRWKMLFYEIVDQFFEGPIAEDAKGRADKMATMFLSKINYYRDNGLSPIV